MYEDHFLAAARAQRQNSKASLVDYLSLAASPKKAAELKKARDLRSRISISTKLFRITSPVRFPACSVSRAPEESMNTNVFSPILCNQALQPNRRSSAKSADSLPSGKERTYQIPLSTPDESPIRSTCAPDSLNIRM